MTKGNFLLNGRNAFNDFGILIARGGYKGFFTPPPLKAVETNDWPEEHGLEVDLSNPVLGARKFDIPFLCTNVAQLNPFFDELTASGNHTFELPEIGVSFNLRLTMEKQNRRVGKGELFTLSFEEDMPFEGYIYQTPVSVDLLPQIYKMDGVALSTGYGILVGDGTDDNFRQLSVIKESLKTQIKTQAGQIYDNALVRFKERKVKMNLLFRTPSTGVFWRNYRAFIHDLTKADFRQIEVNSGVYSCYYLSGACDKFEVLRGGGVWCRVTITLSVN